MNVFRLPTFYLVDLPGYGFAQASKGMRAGYRKLVEGYLKKREQLAGVVWLLDIRHEPSKDDLTFQDLLAESGRPALVVLTKADKLGRQQQRLQAKVIAKVARPHGGIAAAGEQCRGHGNRGTGREHQGGRGGRLVLTTHDCTTDSPRL